MTREALKFAPQGGIAPYRHRAACQMCPLPMPEGADLSINLLGLPVRDAVLLAARDDALAQQIGLTDLASPDVPSGLAAQHERMRSVLVERHARTRERMIQVLETTLPKDVEGLVAHLASCDPCRA